MSRRRTSKLSPLPVRLGVYALLVALAVVSIRLIDRRAMQRMQRFDAAQQRSVAVSPANVPSIIALARAYLRRRFPAEVSAVRWDGPVSTDDGQWIVNFIPRDQTQPGGGFTVFIDARSGTIVRVLRGQ